MRPEVVDELTAIGACTEARVWVGGRRLTEAWYECTRADWLLWYAVKKWRYRQHTEILQATCSCLEGIPPLLPDEASSDVQSTLLCATGELLSGDLPCGLRERMEIRWTSASDRKRELAYESVICLLLSITGVAHCASAVDAAARAIAMGNCQQYTTSDRPAYLMELARMANIVREHVHFIQQPTSVEIGELGA